MPSMFSMLSEFQAAQQEQALAKNKKGMQRLKHGHEYAMDGGVSMYI